jgi:pimeloyl-ACP methyl ester carboxylesterase
LLPRKVGVHGPDQVSFISDQAEQSGVARVNEHGASTIDVNGFATRVWHKGSGPRIGFLAGYGGLTRWVPFLDRLAQTRRVIVPSLPGFPGGDRGHTALDTHLDWVLAVRDLIDKSDLAGADLIGSSVGGSFAAEMAAIWPDRVKRLALIAPFGLFDAKDPVTDPWAQRPDDIAGLMTANPDTYLKLKEMPPGANSIEWPIEQTRAAEAAARIFWPLGNTGLDRRLALITAPTLIVWGENDRLVPRSYASAIGRAIKARTEIRIIPAAGHLAELDKPDEVAAAILGFMG